MACNITFSGLIHKSVARAHRSWSIFRLSGRPSSASGPRPQVTAPSSSLHHLILSGNRSGTTAPSRPPSHHFSPPHTFPAAVANPGLTGSQRSCSRYSSTWASVKVVLLAAGAAFWSAMRRVHLGMVSGLSESECWLMDAWLGMRDGCRKRWSVVDRMGVGRLRSGLKRRMRWAAVFHSLNASLSVKIRRPWE